MELCLLHLLLLEHLLYLHEAGLHVSRHAGQLGHGLLQLRHSLWPHREASSTLHQLLGQRGGRGGVRDVLQLHGGEVQDHAVIGHLHLPTHGPQQLGLLLAVEGGGLVCLHGDNAREEIRSGYLGVRRVEGDPLHQAGSFDGWKTVHLRNLLVVDKLIFLLRYLQLPINNITGVYQSLHDPLVHLLQLVLLGHPPRLDEGAAGPLVEGHPLPPPPPLLTQQPTVQKAEAGIIKHFQVHQTSPAPALPIAHNIQQAVHVVTHLPGPTHLQLLEGLLVVLHHLPAHLGHYARLPAVQQALLQDALLGLGKAELGLEGHDLTGQV